jgi:trigger factor
LETDALQKAESDYLEKVIDAMLEAATQVEYPPQAVEREAESALRQMEQNLSSSGIDLNTYLGMIGKTQATYLEELRPSAEKRLRQQLILGAVAEREGLDVSDEEIETEIDRLVEMMGEQGAEMREMLESAGGRLSVANDLIGAKVQERIIQIGKGEAPDLAVEETADAAATEDTGEQAAAEPEANDAVEPQGDDAPLDLAAQEEHPSPEAEDQGEN